DVAAGYYDADLHAGGGNLGDFAREGLDPCGVDTKSGAAGQHLSAQFEEDALEGSHLLRRILVTGFDSRDIAHLEANETGNGDIFAEFSDFGLHQLVDGEGGFL